MKNTLAKSTQIRPTKKFNTSIKNIETAKKSQQVHASQNKMKTSINKNNNTNRSSNPLSGSSKVRKSISSTTKKKTVNTKNIQDNKKKSIMKKPETATVRKNADKKNKTSVNLKNKASTKRNSMSVSLKKDNFNKTKHKSVQLKNVNLFNSAKNKSKSKTAKKKSVEIYDIDEEEKISSKDSQNNKDLRNSEEFNKNKSIGINIMNNINYEEENNIERNNPLQNELIKEKIASEFIKANIINVDSERRLKNKMVETSNYISEKNKSIMRGLLYLLDKKPEESKNQKNIFRASINSLDKKEKNKLIDMKYQSRKKLYKEKLGKDVKKFNSINSLNEKNSLNVIHEEKKVDSPPKEVSPFLPMNLEDKYQTMKNKYLVMITPSNPKKQYPIFYKDKYFVDYVNGVCPNRDFFERTMKYEKNIYDYNINDGFSEDNYKFNRSYNNKFQFKEKNDLFVDKRDNRYTQYNYGFMINKINDKLDGFNTDRYFRHTFNSFHKNNSDFGLNTKESERNQRVSKIYNDINKNINSVSSPEYQMRKTYSERNPFL